MPHSDDSVPLFTPPPPFSSPPRQITRCRFPSTNLARARGAREKLEEKNGGSGGARVCECMWGGGVKVDINDSSQMSLIHYCIVREML